MLALLLLTHSIKAHKSLQKTCGAGCLLVAVKLDYTTAPSDLYLQSQSQQ